MIPVEGRDRHGPGLVQGGVSVWDFTDRRRPRGRPRSTGALAAGRACGGSWSGLHFWHQRLQSTQRHHPGLDGRAGTRPIRPIRGSARLRARRTADGRRGGAGASRPTWPRGRRRRQVTGVECVRVHGAAAAGSVDQPVAGRRDRRGGQGGPRRPGGRPSECPVAFSPPSDPSGDVRPEASASGRARQARIRSGRGNAAGQDGNQAMIVVSVRIPLPTRCPRRRAGRGCSGIRSDYAVLDGDDPSGEAVGRCRSPIAAARAAGRWLGESRRTGSSPTSPGQRRSFFRVDL